MPKPLTHMTWDNAAIMSPALWWAGDKLTREEAGTFTRERPLDDLVSLLEQAIAKLPS